MTALSREPLESPEFLEENSREFARHGGHREGQRSVRMRLGTTVLWLAGGAVPCSRPTTRGGMVVPPRESSDRLLGESGLLAIGLFAASIAPLVEPGAPRWLRVNGVLYRIMLVWALGRAWPW